MSRFIPNWEIFVFLAKKFSPSGEKFSPSGEKAEIAYTLIS
jgi:hypothetical protein